MLRALRKRNERKRVAAKLCAGIVARSREPGFYVAFHVRDTFDGRFDLLVLHAFLVLERFASGDALAQELIDALFVRLEEGLREQGIGDIGIGRRMKKMAGAFYGRLHAYRDAPDEGALAEALLRNVYRGARVEHAVRLAKYVSAARTALSLCRLDCGELSFGPSGVLS